MLNTESKGLILVREDEFEVQQYLEMALKCLGYSVQLAQDCDEVINFLKSSAPTVSAVLLDIMMPQRDGLETLKAIRDIAPDLPVIILSGASSTLNDVVTAMKCGATDFICKSIAHEDLQKSIAQAIERRAADPA